MRKLRFTTSEIADLRIPGLPATQRSVYKKFKKEDVLEHSIKSRRQTDVGGGRE